MQFEVCFFLMQFRQKRFLKNMVNRKHGYAKTKCGDRFPPCIYASGLESWITYHLVETLALLEVCNLWAVLLLCNLSSSGYLHSPQGALSLNILSLFIVILKTGVQTTLKLFDLLTLPPYSVVTWLSVYPCLCPSVCHTLVFCQNCKTYPRTFLMS